MGGFSSLWKCLPQRHRRQERHVPVPVDEIEEFRARGQSILRAMLTPQAVTAAAPAAASSRGGGGNGEALSSTKTTGRNKNNNNADTDEDAADVDWAAVIQKANQLHQEEEDKLHRKQRILSLKKMKRALERRRRHDAVGSFSINMLTYRTVDATQPASPLSRTHKKHSRGIDNDDGTMTENNNHHHTRPQWSDTSSASDDPSRCSNSVASTKSMGTMHIIKEDIEYLYNVQQQ